MAVQYENGIPEGKCHKEMALPGTRSSGSAAQAQSPGRRAGVAPLHGEGDEISARKMGVQSLHVA